MAIPIKHVHPPGECNRVVSSKFKKHRAVSVDGDEEDDDDYIADGSDSSEEDNQQSDPRWDALRGLDLEDN